MEHKDLSADDLILFATVAELGSVVRASERLVIPKATVSRRLARLEDQLGQKLILRTTRRLVLTEFGTALLEYSRRVAEDVALTRDFAYSRQARPRGLLRVSMSGDYFNSTLAAPVASFAEHYPDIQLEIDLSARQVDIIGEMFDLAIRMGELADDANLVARKIAETNFGIYAAPTYLARHGVPRHPQELARHPAVIFHPVNSKQMAWSMLHGGERIEYIPKGQIALNSPEGAKSLVLLGIGVSILPDNVVAEDLRAQRLVRLLTEWRLATVPAWAVTPTRRFLPVKTRVFIEHLASYFRQSADQSIKWG